MRIARLLCTVLLLVVAQVATAAGPATPRVHAGGETLEGAIDAQHPEVVAFKGIPFAAAPVGELRWREPLPHAARPGVQQATAFAPACYQDSYNMDWYRRVGAAFGASPSVFVDPPVSEDCLYLNVWTPKLDAHTRLPVMVWLYGGSNRAGWSFEPNYQGQHLAQRGQVVVVTVAYRVGIFGFFGHPGLRGARHPTNFGLLDQIAALRWVHDHIAAFGGDARNVTVFGESAGASDVGYLVNSPLAQPLFRRAISQSGGFQMQDRRGLAYSEATGAALSATLPGQPDLAALRQLPSDVVWRAALQTLPGHDYTPVVDGRSVLAAPSEAYSRDGIAHDLLIGSNEDEWYMYVDASPGGLAKDLAALPAPARQALQERADREGDVRRGRDRAVTHLYMVCPGYLMSAAARRTGHAAFIYHFTRVRSGPGGAALGAYHGAEIPYVFGTHDAWLPTGPADLALTDRMIDAWASFARTGRPGPDWPRYDEREPRIMELGDRVGPLPAFDHALCRRWAADFYPGTAP